MLLRRLRPRRGRVLPPPPPSPSLATPAPLNRRRLIRSIVADARSAAQHTVKNRPIGRLPPCTRPAGSRVCLATPGADAAPQTGVAPSREAQVPSAARPVRPNPRQPPQCGSSADWDRAKRLVADWVKTHPEVAKRLAARPLDASAASRAAKRHKA